jgi:hypothetical protein
MYFLKASTAADAGCKCVKHSLATVCRLVDKKYVQECFHYNYEVK